MGAGWAEGAASLTLGDVNFDIFLCACLLGVVDASLVAVTSNNLFLNSVFYTKTQQSDILVLRVSWCRRWGWAKPGLWLGLLCCSGDSSDWVPTPFSPREEGLQLGRPALQ